MNPAITRLHRVLLATWIFACSAACVGPNYSYELGSFDRWDSETDRAVARTARLDFEADRLDEALLRLDSLCARYPSHLPQACLRQEIELALLLAGRTPTGIWPMPSTDEVSERNPDFVLAHLAEHYQRLAEEHESAYSLVLAARLTLDVEGASAMLGRARALDPDCPWGEYGQAFLAFRARAFPEARKLIKTVLESHGAHPPTLRLHATLLANSGDSEEAVLALQGWMELAIEDPLVPLWKLAEARVDLAALQVLVDEPDEALETLAEIDPSLLESAAHFYLVSAVVFEETGRPDLAMEAARRATDVDPAELLGLMQEAVLWRNGSGGASAERQAWEKLLARDDSNPIDTAAGADFSAGLLRLLANARLGRLGRE